MEICGATNRQGAPCRRPAGAGTDHKGTGRCKHHGGASKGAPKGSANALKTGEHARPSRAEQFAKAAADAPVEPTVMLQDQARRTRARLDYMYSLLWQTEDRLEALAASGDKTAVSALAVVEVTRKRELQAGGEKQRPKLAEVELSEKSRSLLDTWHAQHEAITRVELLYGRTAERLKPPAGVTPGTGGIGTLIINNNMPGVDDDDGG